MKLYFIYDKDVQDQTISMRLWLSAYKKACKIQCVDARQGVCEVELNYVNLGATTERLKWCTL